MKNYNPYKLWTKEELESQLLRQVEHYNLPDEFNVFIKKTIYSKRWNPVQDYDGCSVIQDKLHPYLPCYIHDFFWRTGIGGKDSDKLFCWLLRKCDTEELTANLMYTAVRIGWNIHFKEKHRKNNNVRKLDDFEINVLKQIKND